MDIDSTVNVWQNPMRLDREKSIEDVLNAQSIFLIGSFSAHSAHTASTEMTKTSLSTRYGKKIRAIGTVTDNHGFPVGALPPDSHKTINLPCVTNHITQNIVYNS